MISPFFFRQRLACPSVSERAALEGRCSKKIAGKNDIQMAIRQWPGRGTILLKNSNIRLQHLDRTRIHVHCELLGTLNIMYELAVPATQIENNHITRDHLSKQF